MKRRFLILALLINTLSLFANDVKVIIDKKYIIGGFIYNWANSPSSVPSGENQKEIQEVMETFKDNNWWPSYSQTLSSSYKYLNQSPYYSEQQRIILNKGLKKLSKLVDFSTLVDEYIDGCTEEKTQFVVDTLKDFSEKVHYDKDIVVVLTPCFNSHYSSYMDSLFLTLTPSNKEYTYHHELSHKILIEAKLHIWGIEGEVMAEAFRRTIDGYDIPFRTTHNITDEGLNKYKDYFADWAKSGMSLLEYTKQ